MTDNSDNYEDIIHLPHHRSTRHPHMSPAERAAQFSPFAALTGFGETIAETVRETEPMPELSDDEKELIDRRLRQAVDHPEQVLYITHFVPDAHKPGGSFLQVHGTLKRFDPISRSVLLANGTRIPIEHIVDVTLD